MPQHQKQYRYWYHTQQEPMIIERWALPVLKKAGFTPEHSCNSSFCHWLCKVWDLPAVLPSWKKWFLWPWSWRKRATFRWF